MSKLLTITFAVLGFAAFCPHPASALIFSAPNPKFAYTDSGGKKQSVEVVDKYYPKKIVEPCAKMDANIDPKLRRAAIIAEERAHAHSLKKCWQFVKEALVAAGVVKSRPQTPMAKQAGQELVNSYGFKNLPVSWPVCLAIGVCGRDFTTPAATSASFTNCQHFLSEWAWARSSAIVAARRNFGSIFASIFAHGSTIFLG